MHMMHIKSKLDELGLTPENSVVIGSGILNVLGIRESNDIDLVVTANAYTFLSEDDSFRKAENHGKNVLENQLFEIGTSWDQLGRSWEYDDLFGRSVVIGGVRYITLEFLLEVKRSWLSDKNVRQKDIDDVKLIEDYLLNH